MKIGEASTFLVTDICLPGKPSVMNFQSVLRAGKGSFRRSLHSLEKQSDKYPFTSPTHPPNANIIVKISSPPTVRRINRSISGAENRDILASASRNWGQGNKQRCQEPFRGAWRLLT